jgi:hypothetical protein
MSTLVFFAAGSKLDVSATEVDELEEEEEEDVDEESEEFLDLLELLLLVLLVLPPPLPFLLLDLPELPFLLSVPPRLRFAEFHRFLIPFSLRPRICSAIFTHLLPNAACHLTKAASSSGVQGPFASNGSK